MDLAAVAARIPELVVSWKVTMVRPAPESVSRSSLRTKPVFRSILLETPSPSKVLVVIMVLPQPAREHRNLAS